MPSTPVYPSIGAVASQSVPTLPSAPIGPSTHSQPPPTLVVYIKLSPIVNYLKATAALLTFSTFEELNNYFDTFMNNIDLLAGTAERPNTDLSLLKLFILFVVEIAK